MGGRVAYAFGALAVLSGIVFYNNMTRGENPDIGRLEESVGESIEGSEKRTYADCANLFGHEKYRDALQCFNELLESEPENTEARIMRDKTLQILKKFHRTREA